MADERLSIILDARDNTRGAFASVKQGLGGLRDDAERTGGSFSNLSGAITGAFAGAGFAAVNAGVSAVGGAFGALKSSVIDTNATLEQGKVSWGVLLGSTEEAEKQLNSLFTFAGETPFEFPEVQKAALLLQTFGGSALNSADNLKLVGDIASGVNQPFADVAMWYGRMYDAIKSGRPFGEAAARLQEMGAMSGETRAKLEDMQKTGADGTVIWSTFTGEMGRFGGMMEKQSQTFSGRLSTMRDSLNMLAAQAGKPIFDLLSRGLGQLNTLLASPALAAFVQNLAARLAAGIERVGGAITGLATSRAWRLIQDAVMTFQQAFNRRWFGGATEEINGFVRLVGVWGTLLGNIVKAFRTLFSGAEDATIGNFLVNITRAFGQFWTDLGKNVGIEVPRLLGGLRDTLREGIPIVADALKEWWTAAAAPQLTYWIDQLGGWFTGTALPFVGTFLARVGQAFGDWVVESAIPWLQQNLPEWINAVGAWFQDTAIPFVVTSLQDLGKRFGDWITGSAIPWLEQEWPKFTATLVELLDSGPTVTEVGNAAIALGEVVGPKVAAGMNSGPSVGRVGDGVVAFIGATNQKIGENLPTWLTNWGQFGATVGGAVNVGMTSGPSTAEVGNGVIAFIAATNQKANENLPTWLTNWQKFGETVGGAVWAGMTSGPSVEQVGNAVGAFIAKVNEELARRLPDWVTTWSGFGGAIGNAILNAIKAVFTPPWMRGGGEGVNPSGDAPAGGPGLLEAEPRQHGGPVSAGLRYLVGERGPELFVPRMAGMILSRAETEAAIRAIEDEDRRLVAQSRALRAAGAREKSPEVSAIGARLDELERERMRLRGQLAGAQPREILRSAQPPILPSGIAGGPRGGGGDTITIAPGAFQISFPNMQVSNGIGLEAVAQAAQSGVQRGLRQGYAPGRVR